MDTITVNGRQFKLRDLKLESARVLVSSVYSHVAAYGYSGHGLTAEEWQEYCYIYRLASRRFSDTGLRDALLYAQRHSLDSTELGTMADYGI